MYKVTNKKTGFHHYFNAKESAKFVVKNGESKYQVNEIKEFDLKNFLYMILTFIIISSFTLLMIYYATI